MDKVKKQSRREFINAIGAVTAGSAMAAQLKASTASSYSRIQGSNEEVRIAVMGTNSRGHSLARNFARLARSEVVYICDVDKRAVEKTQAHVREHQSTNPKGTADLRQVLDDPAVDALVIAAPDHWHAPAAILALKAGKHVYVEKPCSHNAWEGELLVKAARKSGHVVQMGNQRRSYPRTIEAIEALKSGVIGPVHYARSFYSDDRGPIGKGRETPAPDWLDYELWQGPAPRRPFRDNLIHYNWHWFWHWGTGESGNNAVHSMDLCRWGLGVDFPLKVSSTGGRYWYKDDDWETPDTQVITLEFEGGKAMTWEGLSCNRSSNPGLSFHGEGGTLLLTSGGYTVFDTKNKATKTVADEPGQKDAVHLVNFLQAIRGQGKLNSPIDEGHKSTLLCHLGNIALRTGRTLHCDPANGHIKGDKEAAKFWRRDYQPGWWVPTM